MVRMRTAIVLSTLCAGLLIACPDIPEENGPCPGTALEKGPTLISDLEPFKSLVRSAGYRGRIILTVTVTESGSVRHPEIKQPARLNTDKRVLKQVRALRFCPAVKYSRYTAISPPVRYRC